MSAVEGHHLVGALERIAIPVFLLDTGGVIGWTNPAGRRLLGGPRVEIVGQSCLRFVAPEEQAAVRRAIAGLARGEIAAVKGRLTSVHGDGRRLPLDASFAAVRTDDSVAGVLVVCAAPPERQD